MHFLSSVEGVNLQQRIVGRTHKDGGTLVLSRPDENLVGCWSACPRLGSDHHIVFCKLIVPKPEVQKEVSSSRNFRNSDTVKCNNEFQTSLNPEVIDSENNVYLVINDFEKAVTATLDKHAPVTKKIAIMFVNPRSMKQGESAVN